MMPPALAALALFLVFVGTCILLASAIRDRNDPKTDERIDR